ncbi:MULTISPECIES: 2-polyprenyl-3-methyl-6-methoxy-1,4-benzoquinone monooxygenase [unclassified Legionella]|uniref:2-polyprenyl-3-methyl-6-methoxy-1,4-benzoquinone monooxygenase n=1 Tax=unclassified Legionella TaxID=2622702 RepID=UPI0010562427|nr:MULTISPECIES: 2-polyprenyl-3-methyl-6-methoxy-1,4-benzoquinone monooxygenase [unclassified Legionella]MDI9817980.1 2-polyprenyl-3-methyl-6-methoxy-1,4-benzoquinone monooxygenase [Legionella sp. PL877]
MRKFSLLDNLLGELDTALRTLLPPKPRTTARPSPAQPMEEIPMTASEKRHTAGLMRVNHAGEVCAQALYQGQALTAQLPGIRQKMADAAAEEIDHLAWCEGRLQELGSQPSLLNPIWYLGSLTLGLIAGLIGDRWSLGFVTETELQVLQHLQGHLQKLPPGDEKTKAILEQMYEDEAHHAEVAKNAGAAELPILIKKLMQKTSKLMTHTSYYI